jgi:hypothetical protein
MDRSFFISKVKNRQAREEATRRPVRLQCLLSPPDKVGDKNLRQDKNIRQEWFLDFVGRPIYFSMATLTIAKT